MWMCVMEAQRLPLLVALVIAVGYVKSDYLITTPRRWTVNAQSQICVALTDGAFAASDFVNFEMTEKNKNTILRPKTDLVLPEGMNNACLDVTVPYTDERRVFLSVKGSLSNLSFEEKLELTVVKEAQKIFIQTDKYLYKPGQKVQIRILTINGPKLKVFTDMYEEVYIENPSRTRIGQWLNVSNENGLVHLEFDLFDEIEEGHYTIYAKFPNKPRESRRFQVSDYVLPRYEVTVEAPKNILGSDESVTIKLCARYTYGEPVEGTANFSLAAGNWKVYANLTETKNISGCQNFTFPTKDLLFDQNNCHIRIGNLQAHATVTEEGTGVKLYAADENIRVNRKALTFSDESPQWTNKPFLPAPVYIACKYPDGSPARNETIKLCFDYEGEEICKNFQTCNKGYLSYIMPSQKIYRVSMKAVKYPKIERNWNDVMSESSHYKYSNNDQQYIDNTNSSLTIYHSNKINCTTGQRVKVTIPVIYIVKDLTKAQINYQVISRGQVVLSNRTSVDFTTTPLPFSKAEQLLPLEDIPQGFTRGVFNLDLDLPSSVSPGIKVLVWYSTSDKNVVADSKDITVTDCLSHKVDFSWSKTKTEPGSQANLILKGANRAICSVGVVDKSVELLSSLNDHLTIDSVLQTSLESEVSRWDKSNLDLAFCKKKYPNTLLEDAPVGADDYNSYSMKEAIHMFESAGYYVISNLILEKLFCEDLIIRDLKDKHGDHIANRIKERPLSFAAVGDISSDAHGAPPINAQVASVGGASSKEGGNEETRERIYLPETWLWEIKILSENGTLEEAKTVPDTITEWVGKAVCIHPEEGVGLSSKASIVTFTPFFVDLTLPSTATRGETLPIIISIFNYLDTDLPVNVFVEPNENFEFVSGELGKRDVCVPSKKKSVVTIKVLLNKIADVNITVEAGSQPTSASCGSGEAPTKKDRLVKSLPVEPEGYIREQTWSRYLCAEDYATLGADTPAETYDIQVPPGIVEGSERAWITAIGDLMGPTVENINSLVRLPSGCGEQNMVHFAPSIYVLQYLVASNQMTDFLEKKLTGILNHGYQRQLLFRHSDGAYSAFGEKHTKGSTWMTAFVFKSLAEARPFTQIDIESLKQSAEWLKNLQRPNGCFESRGRVVNKQLLQGGLKSSNGSEALLTAYVLSALLEYGDVGVDVAGAVKCIQTDTSDHPYSLALKAYSLAIADPTAAKPVVEKLLAVSISNSSDMRWTLPDRRGQATSLHVETAAYALLSLVTLDYGTYAIEARKIMRWMSGLRNGQGGFISTQDTVVALKAFAEFEEAKPSQILNNTVRAVSTQLNIDPAFKIDTNNKFLQQRVDVEILPASVDFFLSGEGCSLVQGVLRYNVLADSKSDAFMLIVKTNLESKSDCRTQRITACTSYTLDDGASNMAIIEVKLISGYVPMLEDLKEVVGIGESLFKRYEVNGRKVFFYLDQVNATEVCASFRVYQEVPLEGVKPGTVSVYDYYQPEFITTEKYSFEATSCVKE